jgi:uncharacterized protein YigA (DUF484 family)
MTNTAEILDANGEATEETATNDFEPQQVAEWLLANPAFFTENPELLRQLELGSNHGTSISLQARQLTALRDRIAELELERQETLDVLHNNEAVTQRLHKLLVNLAECNTERQLFQELERAMTQDFSVDFYAWHSAGSLGDQIPTELHELRQQPNTLMGRLNKPVVLSCFGQHIEEVASACVLSLHYKKQFLGLLALGSKDEMRFTDRPGTGLLERFGAVLGGILGSKYPQE